MKVHVGQPAVGAESDPQTAVGGLADDLRRLRCVEAFRTWWNGADSAPTTLRDSTPGAAVVGAGLMACAGIVLALKIQVIVQLVLLAIQIAQAVATAAVTFGASLLEIPIFKMITSMILDQLIGMAIEAVLNG